jgi:hypothetical protein
METVANRRVRDFGGGGKNRSRGCYAKPADFPLHDVPRTGVYAYDVGVWDSSIVQGPFSVAPCQTLMLRFATFASLYASVSLVELSHNQKRRFGWVSSVLVLDVRALPR